MKLMNGDNGNASRINRFVLRESLVRLPAKISAPVWRNIEKELPLALMQVETIDDFVPPHTRVYIHGGNRGNLNINLRGREPQGIVTEPERGHLLAQLTDDLLSIRDPDNESSIFSEVYESKDLYEGPLSCFAPDLVGDYYLSDWSMRVNLPGLHRRPSRYFLTEEAWYGDHSRDGIFIFTGSDFGRSNERGLANLLDIPATLLYLYDVPLPSDYDGKPLADSILSGHPVRYQPGDNRILEEKDYVYSSDEEREVLERLSDLGYLD
jgi:hypothetical protein